MRTPFGRCRTRIEARLFRCRAGAGSLGSRRRRFRGLGFALAPIAIGGLFAPEPRVDVVEALLDISLELLEPQEQGLREREERLGQIGCLVDDFRRRESLPEGAQGHLAAALLEPLQPGAELLQIPFGRDLAASIENEAVASGKGLGRRAGTGSGAGLRITAGPSRGGGDRSKEESPQDRTRLGAKASGPALGDPRRFRDDRGRRGSLGDRVLEEDDPVARITQRVEGVEESLGQTSALVPVQLGRGGFPEGPVVGLVPLEALPEAKLLAGVFPAASESKDRGPGIDRRPEIVETSVQFGQSVVQDPFRQVVGEAQPLAGTIDEVPPRAEIKMSEPISSVETDQAVQRSVFHRVVSRSSPVGSKIDDIGKLAGIQPSK